MSRRLKWIILSIGLSLVVLGAIVGWVWQLGWFSPSAPVVLKDTLVKANSGNYAAAAENLFRGQRDVFLKDPQWERTFWKTITKDGTIANVKIIEEKYQSESVDILFEITYKDGASLQILESIGKEDNRWKVLLGETYKQAKSLGPVPPPPPSVPLKLMDEYTQIPGSNVSVRLPVGLIWNEQKKQYENVKLGISIHASSGPGPGPTH